MQLFDEHRIDLLQGAAMNVDRVRGANGAIVYAAAPAVHPTVTGSTVLTLHVSNLGPSEQILVTVRFGLGV